MSTTSTIPAVKAQLVTKFTTALATSSTSGGQVQVSYAWPTNAQSETVFLGRTPDDAQNEINATQTPVGLNPGRLSRDESYAIPVTIWSFRPDLTPAGAATCEARAFTLLGRLEDVVANDLEIGLGITITEANLAAVLSTLRPENNGWKCELVATFHVEARLT